MSPNLTDGIRSERSALGRAHEELTPREWEVLGEVAQGRRNPDIAERLHISTGTVKNHVHSILQKLGLPSRLKLIAWAHRHEVLHFARRNMVE